jgi:two-component system cell cycle sensor histidine kinase/response regulator CckA
VLILEDNLDDAKLCLSELARADFEVDSDIASNSQEFMALIKAQPYDLILADYGLPDWTGVEALRWLRKSGYTTPFILVTGTLGDDVAVECIKEGAADYVLKHKLDCLARACRRAVDEATVLAQRDRAEAELRDSEHQYKLLFDTSPAPMWVFDRETLCFLAVNEAAVRHYGFSREEFLAMTIRDVRPKDETLDPVEVLLPYGEGAGRVEAWRHRKKNGALMEVEITSNSLIFAGKPAELVLAHDITNLIDNLEQLRQSEERFAKAFRSSPLPITISTRAEGRYLDVNDAFLKMVGSTREEVVGSKVGDIKVWIDPEGRGAMLQQLAETGSVRAFPAKFGTPSGDIRIVEISAELIDINGVPCLLAITHDVSEEKRLEEQFRQAQKMEAVGRLAGGIAHDFNNMLSVIIGYSELLQDRFESGPSRKAADEIKKAAERTVSLTRQLLAFSRRQVLSPRIMDLNITIANLATMLTRMIGEDIELVLAPMPALGCVKADPAQVEQIIMNLVVNARDAMPQGGKVVIATSNLEVDSSNTYEHPSVRPGSYVLLAVSDTGSGMSETTKLHIFEPFFTTKGPGKGTGLGLSMVYGVVNQSGGYIWVDSAPGKGTTFRIYFPRVNEAATVEPRKVEFPMVKGSETILLVEDEESLRLLTASSLESNGYKVLQAGGGEEGIRLAKQHGHIDLLMTDVVMPGLSGRDLAALLRLSLPQVKLLYISGYTGDVISQHGVLETDATLLEKPFTKSALLNRVRMVLDGL